MTNQETLAFQFLSLMRRNTVSDDRACTSPTTHSPENSFQALAGPLGAEHPGTIQSTLYLPIMLVDSRDVLYDTAMQWLHFDACEAQIT